MIRWNPKTGRWSDELPTRLCDFVGNPGVIGSTPAVAGPSLAVDGSATNATSSTGFVYTVNGAIPAGALVIIAQCGTSSLFGVSDSKSNTYAIDINSAATSSASIASSILATALSPGDTITLSWTSASVGRAFVVMYVTDNVASSPLDKTGSASQSASILTPTTSAATTNAKDIVVGVVAASTVVSMTSMDPNYTQLMNLTYGATPYRAMAGYWLVTTTGTKSFTVTMGASGGLRGVIAAYKRQ